MTAITINKDNNGSRWDRLLWGVEHVGLSTKPMLIGNLWAGDMRGDPYPGEPTRALLFCTRKEARKWCADTMYRYKEDDSLKDWRLRPVRVRETVQVVETRKQSE